MRGFDRLYAFLFLLKLEDLLVWVLPHPCWDLTLWRPQRHLNVHADLAGRKSWRRHKTQLWFAAKLAVHGLLLFWTEPLRLWHLFIRAHEVLWLVLERCVMEWLVLGDGQALNGHLPSELHLRPGDIQFRTGLCVHLYRRIAVRNRTGCLPTHRLVETLQRRLHRRIQPRLRVLRIPRHPVDCLSLGVSAILIIDHFWGWRPFLIQWQAVRYREVLMICGMCPFLLTWFSDGDRSQLVEDSATTRFGRLLVFPLPILIVLQHRLMRLL